MSLLLPSAQSKYLYFALDRYLIQMIEFISQPWPWYVAGPIISLVMFLLLYFGKNFGLSSNLRTMCTILGAGRRVAFFNFDWRKQIWNLVFSGGLVLGGFLASQFLVEGDAIQLSASTQANLAQLGVETNGNQLVPESIFNFQSLGTVRGLIIMVVGGFLIGFGTRYAGGCTSGHAISGLSNLQLPSLIAVIGFFIGGLTVTHLILPHLLALNL